MNQLLIQIISGVVVAIVSFGFGYSLFRSQSNEQIRLEVYRRRLNAFEELVKYLDDLDHFAHRLSPKDFSQSEKSDFTMRGLKISMGVSQYLTSEVSNMFEFIVMSVWELPESLAKIEEADYEIHSLIFKDVGSHLPNYHTEALERAKKLKKITNLVSS